MPDGRVWEDYQKDPLAGICQEPEVKSVLKLLLGNILGKIVRFMRLLVGSLSLKLQKISGFLSLVFWQYMTRSF